MTLRPNDYDRNGDIIPDSVREEKEVRLIDANALYRQVKTECNPYGKPTIDFESGKKVLKLIDNAPTVELRLMTVEEGAGHTIEYAMGWKACIEWLKQGADMRGEDK